MSLVIFGFDPDNYKCKPCIKAKMFADSRNIPYVFKAILKEGTSEESRANKKELGELRKGLDLPMTGFTMPQIFEDGKLIGGFDELRSKFA